MDKSLANSKLHSRSKSPISKTTKSPPSKNPTTKSKFKSTKNFIPALNIEQIKHQEQIQCLKTEQNSNTNLSDIDQTFRSHKTKIKFQDKQSCDEYIYDIENTWFLNLEILNNILIT